MIHEAKPLIPTEIHGFKVEVGVGPYPPDQDTSDRKAMYAKLRPVTAKTRERMAHKGRDMILSHCELHPDLAAKVLAGDEEAAEFCAFRVLSEASALAREMNR